MGKSSYKPHVWGFHGEISVCIDLKSNDLPSLVLLKLRQGEADEVHWVDCILDCKKFTLMGWFNMGMSPNLGKLRSVAALFYIHLSTEIWRRMILTILTSLNLLNIQQLACLRPSKRCQLCVCVCNIWTDVKLLLVLSHICRGPGTHDCPGQRRPDSMGVKTYLRYFELLNTLSCYCTVVAIWNQFWSFMICFAASEPSSVFAETMSPTILGFFLDYFADNTTIADSFWWRIWTWKPFRWTSIIRRMLR